MKRLLILVGLLAWIPGVAGAEEIHQGQASLSIGGGAQHSSGNDFESGTWYLFGIGHDNYLHPNIAVGGELFYARYRELKTKLAGLELALSLKFLLFDNTNSPYARITGGLNLMDPVGIARFEESFAGGLGWQIKGGGNTGFFAEALYNIVDDDDEQLEYIRGRVGLIFYLGKATQ